jgi:ribonuclease HI
MKIYTDGATSKNGSKDAIGGWAYIVVNEVDNIIAKDSGHVEHATNNICELLAVINACKAVSILNTSFTIYSDSAYIIKCYKDKWYKNWLENDWINSKKKPVANKELWEELIPFFQEERFNFEKVKGHSGNIYNEIVDKMAVAAKENKE